ncbi:hypothetical protein, conserved [Eimeria brunetti]|uniref:Uncharacterized protein n=1 Tax=Eimeria brunetti TaxID=51314 RepID=U6LU62_9EIME|nr:hypothetical protein, conserved [Eimeria brunetti]
MARRPQDKLEAAAEAAGAAAAAAAASVWRFFEDDSVLKQDAVESINAVCDSGAQNIVVEKQETPAVATGTATAAKLARFRESAAPTVSDTSTAFAAAPADGGSGNLSNRDRNSNSSDSSTTATSKDTSPLGPRGVTDELSAPAACTNSNISSSANNVDSDSVTDSSLSGSCSSSSNECNNGCGGDSSSRKGGEFTSALRILGNVGNRVLAESPHQPQQQEQHQQKLLLQGTTEEPQSHEGIQSAAPVEAATVQIDAAAVATAPGVAAAAAVVAAAIAAAEAGVRGCSYSELSSNSNSNSSTTHYQTSTTPEAVQVAHRLPQQQQQEKQLHQGRDDNSVNASAANTTAAVGLGEAAGSAAEVATAPHATAEANQGEGTHTAVTTGAAEARAGAGIHKLVESRLGYATDIGGQLQQTAQQTAAKKHPEEGKQHPKLCIKVKGYAAADASTPSWYRHKRHTFIFSYSGKPVYSRYGKEENLGAFAGALSAIVSKLERFRGDKPPDVVRHFRCFGGRFVFLPRGPFYLALFDRQSINNNVARAYLMLLHRQLVCILTKEVERTLLIRPSFDVRPLMGGTDGIFRGLHRHYFNSMLSVLLPVLLESNCAAVATAAPAGAGAAAPSSAAEQLQLQQQQQEQQAAALSISGAFEALPLSSTMRHIATTAVKNGPTPNVLASMLLAEQRVVSVSYAKGYELSSTDVCLLTNFSSILPVLRERFSVFHLLTDSIRFHHLANHCNKLFAMLTNTGCLAAIETSLEYAPYALPRCLWGEIALVHCALFVPSLSQYFSSAFGDDYKTDVSKQQRVYTLYTSAAELIQNAKRPAHSFVETTDEKVYVWLTVEFFFFCCVPRWINVSTTLVEQLAKWIREQQPFLFITDTPPLVHTPQQK